jgi:predicted permease
MAGMVNEIRQAVRRLGRTPVFTLAAGLTLALAIGANAAIFALVQRVVLNPLPYPESQQLIRVEHGIPRINVPAGIGMTSGLYYQYQRARALEGLAISRSGEATLVGRGEPLRIQVARTTPTLASVLRVPPALGRWFTDEEGGPGAPLVAVLSHGLWVRRFGGDSGVLGTSITLDGVAASVIGVMPASFGYPDPRTEAWLPAPISRATGFGLPFGYVGVARLRSGVTLAQTRAELNELIKDLPNAFPGNPGVLGNVVRGGLNSTPITLKDATVGNVSRGLWILLAAVGVVLLVACANVANLFLVRSEARQREVAVRRALGASGASLARFFLAESVLLSAAGGVIGLALASAAVQMLVSLGPATLPRLEEIRLDAVALGFTFGLTLLIALVFGSIPLWRAASPAASLNEVGRGNTTSRGRHRTRQLLMGGQVALALVLLVASGLMIRSFQNLRAFDPGFRVASALTFRIGLPERRTHRRPGQPGRRPGAGHRPVVRGVERLRRGHGRAARSRPRHAPRRRRATPAQRRRQSGVRRHRLSRCGSDWRPHPVECAAASGRDRPGRGRGVVGRRRAPVADHRGRGVEHAVHGAGRAQSDTGGLHADVAGGWA